MIFRRIEDEQGTGHHSLVEIEDFEFVSPMKQISEMLINSQIHFERDFLRISGFSIDNALGLRILTKRALEEWDKRYKGLKKLAVPEGLMSVLTIDSKREQIRALKGIELNSEQLLAFLLRAGEEHGYVYSQYRGEHLPKGMDSQELPTLAEVREDGQVEIIGKTELTKGKIKHGIEQRHVAVSKFLDRKDRWHCLFLTYKSLGGEENYKGGQPHLHYISNAWGLTRDYVVGQLKGKNYKLPALPHIDFERRPMK